MGVDIQEVIAAANSQPYSHIHQPGIGVGGHCIPVYPHFLLSRAPEMELVELSRRVNDGQIGLAIRTIQKALGGLEGVPVLVLGLTYRHGVKELAYSRALPLIERLAFHGAIVSAYDPLLSEAEIARSARQRRIAGGRPVTPGRSSPRRPTRSSGRSTSGYFPAAEVLFDGRNSLRDLALPERIGYHGVGVPAAARLPAEAAVR